MRSSVIVGTFGRGHFLRWTLRSVVEQTVPAAEYEVIVVEGVVGRSPGDSTRSKGAEDEVWRTVSAEAGRSPVSIRYFYEPGGSLEVGLRAARGEVVVQVKAGDVVAPEWLYQVLSQHEKEVGQAGILAAFSEG